MSNLKNQIIKALQQISGFKDLNLEFPENEKFGDFSSNVALQAFGTVASAESKNIKLHKKVSNFSGKSPREFAENITIKLSENKDLLKIIEKIEVAGPGFINFWLRTDVLVDNLKQIDIEKEKYGRSEIGKGKSVVIDYSGPNIAKSFGIGHLRSTIIGQALYNFYEFLGYKVIGDNHLGDWGTQFGKLLFMITERNLKDFDIAKLEELYVEFHQLVHENPELENKGREWFKRLEEGDKTAREIWQKCIDISLKEFDRIYKLLGVKIDFAFGESYYEDMMKKMLSDSSIKKHLSKGEDGALIVDLASVGIKTPLIFLKSDGATIYATRDLATIKFRAEKWNPDIIIYEVGAEQTLHFEQVFAAAKILGLVDEKVELVHTKHGLYLAPDGKKFSTRKGKTIKLDEVLIEAIERARILMGISGNLRSQWTGDVKGVAERHDELSSGKLENDIRSVGIGAIKYFDLMHSVQSNVVFDWEKIMNMEGNSGPYLQYTVARANSVLLKAKFPISNFQFPINFQINNEEMLVLRTLSQFPEMVQASATAYSPNLLCNYLYDLASKYNSFYNKHSILTNSDQLVTNFRLALTSATGQVLKNGLKLLGIDTPEKM